MNDSRLSFLKIIQHIGVDYFKDGTDIGIRVSNGKIEITKIENIFKKNIPTYASCLKLFHNMELINSYANNYPIDTHTWGFEDYMLQEKDSFYLELHVDSGTVTITNKAGYGSIFTNHKGILATLMSTNSAIKEYLKKLIKKDLRYKELTRIINFNSSDLPSDYAVDDSVDLFVKNNKDLFEIE